jgi:hypothetical protein
MKFRQNSIATRNNFGVFSEALMLLVLTLCFFGPAHIYFNNVLDFSSTFRNILPFLALASVALYILLLPLGYFRGRVTMYCTSILFGLALMLWVQGNLLLWDYGLITGQDVDWAGKSLYGIIDLFVWGAVVAAAIALPQAVLKLIRPVSRGLVLIQFISLLVLVFNAPEVHFKGYSEDTSMKYTLGRDRNVIILVIDSFQPDSFSTAIKNFPVIAELLDGFTFYPDATAGYPRTYPSVPFMLTGKYYENDIPFLDYIESAYMGTSIPMVLRNQGFHVYMPLKPYIMTSPELSSSLKRNETFTATNWSDVGKVALVSIFRQSPQFIKKAIYPDIVNYSLRGISNDSKKTKHSDLVFLDEFKDALSPLPGGPDKTFKYYHLNGLHVPFELNENLQIEPMPFDRQGLMRVTYGQLKLLAQMLRSIKTAGVYDNTMLLVMGDHGADFPSSTLMLADGTMAYVNPLVLVKPFSSRGRLNVSDLPVSHLDVKATVFDALGLNIEDTPGLSMLKRDARHEGRVRRFLSLDWNHEYFDKAYEKPLLEYQIKGNALKVSSWSRTGRIFPPRFEIATLFPASFARGYYLGQQVRFGSDGNATRYITGNWQKEGISITSTPLPGCKGSMKFSVLPTDDKLSVEITFESAPELLSILSPSIEINGFRVRGKHIFKGLYRFDVYRRGIASSGIIDLEIEVCEPEKNPLKPVYLRIMSISEMV